MLAEVGNFVFRAFRPQPADEERGEHPADRHDGVVGDEVHRVEEIFAAYLREVPADGERRGDAENGDGNPHDDRRLRAVSYTHLDVYKRQVLKTVNDAWERTQRRQA